MDFAKELEKRKKKQRKQLEKDINKVIKNGTYVIHYNQLPSLEVINVYLDIVKELDVELKKNGYYLETYHSDTYISFYIRKTKEQ